MAARPPLTVESVYAAHFPFVWRVLRRMGVSEQDMADAVQDVFLVVHRKLGGFQGNSKVTTWLFSICMRVASERRRQAHAKREVPHAAPADLAELHGDLTEEIERRQAYSELEQILDQMPLEQRAVFTLFELEGEHCESIAEIVGVPIGTVYSRLRLARGIFKRALERRNARQDFELRNIGVHAT